MTTGINKRIAIGAGWGIAFRWADRIIGLVSIAILARLLIPADFGLVGYAIVFLAILDEFFAFSFETVLIRERDATKDHYSTVWTLELFKGLVLSVLIASTAKLVSSFFGEPKLEIVLYWFAIIPILNGLKNIGTVDFQKNLQFHKEFYFNVIVRLGGTITTVALALLLRSYWALVYGAIVRAALRVALSFLLSDFRPRICLSQFSRVLGFSKWLLAQNVLGSMTGRLPAIVIGRYFESQVLAFFTMAREFGDLSKEFVGAPIRRALYPGISKLQDDRSKMAKTLEIAMGATALIGLPVAIGIGVTAPLIVPLALGSNWNDVVPIVQILSLHAAMHVYYPNTHVIYYVLNQPHLTAYISILRLSLLVPVILTLVPQYGGIGAAWSLLIVNSVVMIAEYVVLLRKKVVTLSNILRAVWRSTLAVLLMAVSTILALNYPLTAGMEHSNLLHLAFCVATGVVSYVTVTIILWMTSGCPDGSEASVLRALKAMIRRPA